MTKKTDDYYTEQAKAYNAIGGTHHDPRVRQEQRMQGNLVIEPNNRFNKINNNSDSDANASAVGLVLIASLCIAPFIPLVYLYIGLRDFIYKFVFQERLIEASFFEKNGVIFSNTIADMVLVLGVIAIVSFLLSRSLGYFVSTVFIAAITALSANRVGSIIMIVPIIIYVIYWVINHEKNPLGWILTSVISLLAALIVNTPYSYYEIYLNRIEYVGTAKAYSEAGQSAFLGAMACLLLIYICAGIGNVLYRIKNK